VGRTNKPLTCGNASSSTIHRPYNSNESSKREIGKRPEVMLEAMRSIP
jgi:hypothetical protein